jgi:hypothetical protein
MSDKHNDTQALATYLIGLALLQKNQRVHVNREIVSVVQRLQDEFKLKN